MKLWFNLHYCIFFFETYVHCRVPMWQTRNSMDQEKLPVLPFPVIDKVDSIEQYPGSITYCLTLPMTIFAPAMGRMSEGKNSTLYTHHMKLFTMFIHLFQQRFRVENPNNAYTDEGNKRFSMFFEYLVSDQVNITNPSTFKTTLINCIGIRFYFIVNGDGDVNFIEALKGVLNEQSGKDDSGKRRKNWNNPKKDKNSVGGVPMFMYDFFLGLESINDWFSCCQTYLNKKQYSEDFMNSDLDQETLMPTSGHPYHPRRIFSFDTSCRIKGIHPMQKTRHFNQMPLPNMTFEVFPVMWQPIAMLAATMPLTTDWVNQGDMGAAETLRVFCDRHRLERYYHDGYMKKNDLKDIRRLYDARKSDIQLNFTDTNEIEEQITKLSTETIRSIQDVWCDTASVSDPIKAMYRWAMDYTTWTLDDQYMVWDKDLSYFGNMMATEYWRMEYDFGFSTTHNIVLRCLIASFDAYRYEYNLHCNVLLCGAGATGKSHMLDTLEDVLIPKTTIRKSHQTAKAMTVDSDINDHITLYHETPPDFLGQGDKNSDQATGSHLIKDMMTKCIVTTSTIKCDNDTTRRHNVTAESECVGTIFMATNERADMIPEALGTRMNNINVDVVDREKFGVNEKSGALQTEQSKRDKLNHITRWRMRQLMCNMVNKAIYIGCLKDVDLTIPNRIFGKISEYMEVNGYTGNGQTIRGRKFLLLFIRTLTIIHACDKYANDPLSPGYKKEITFENLMGIQPYLMASEEISLFGFTMNRDALVDTNMFKTMEVLTGAFSDTIRKDSSALPADIKGYVSISQYPEDRKRVYTKMSSHSKTPKLFTHQISRENMIGAFRALTATHFKGAPVLIEMDGELRIHNGYLREFFNWDSCKGRYTTKAAMRDVVFDAFKHNYCHQHMPERRKFILGSSVDDQFPFALETVDVVPNQNHLFTWHDPSADIFADEVDVADDCARGHLEEFALKEYCGETNVDKYLYSHRISGRKLAGTYPENLVKRFIKIHGVKPTDRKRINIDDESKAYQVQKKQKLN